MENKKILYHSNFILFDQHNQLVVSIYELDSIKRNTIALYTWFSVSNKIYHHSDRKPSADLLSYLESIGVNNPSVVRSSLAKS